MTVLSRASRSLNNPALPLSGSAIATWLAGKRSLSGVSVTEESAMGLAAYLRGVMLLSGTMASTPLVPYQAGTLQQANPPPLLRGKMNPGRTQFEFWETMYAHAIGWGNGYALKVRNAAGSVVECWSFHPSRVEIETVNPSELVPDGKIFWIRDQYGERHSYTSRDIFHVPGFSLDGVRGVSPVQYARQTIGTALAAEEYTARFFGNGSLMSGVLQVKQKITGPAAADLKASWRDKIGGLDKAHEIAVLDNGAEFKPISIPPGDAQLLESRKFSVLEVSRILGIPPHLLNDVEKSTSWGTGIEQQFQTWISVTLRAWFTRFEQRTSTELLPLTIDARYNLDDLRRGDMVARAQFYVAAVATGGWLNRAEVRQKEGEPPAPDEAELDEFLHPANFIVGPGNAPETPASVPVAEEGDTDAEAA